MVGLCCGLFRGVGGNVWLFDILRRVGTTTLALAMSISSAAIADEPTPSILYASERQRDRHQTARACCAVSYREHLLPAEKETAASAGSKEREKIALTDTEFFDKAATIGASGLTVYIHGCCTSARDAMSQTILLSKALKRPVLLYDWNTSELNPLHILSAADYAKNQIEVERSEDCFYQFLETLTQCLPAEKISLFCFSKGAYLATRTLVRRFEQQHEHLNQFKTIALLSPDIA
jgi:esterase/lipase superfamily enzyme